MSLILKLPALGFLAAVVTASPVFSEERTKAHLPAVDVISAFNEVCREGRASPSSKAWVIASPQSAPLAREDIGSDSIELKKLFSTDGGKTIIKVESESGKGGNVTYCSLKTSLVSNAVSDRLTSDLTSLAKSASLGEPEKHVGRRFKNTNTSWNLKNWRLDTYDNRKVRSGIVAISLQSFPPEAPAKSVFIAAIAVNRG
ncbi:hypothetical protein FY137_06610 [Agrobacterium tumefaciens]|nr:hypothetical protein FY137_06610 [Agrobacterium tumefaciens]